MSSPYPKAIISLNEGIRIACDVIKDAIKTYAEEKYDDYEYRHMLTAKERLNNEFARDVVDDLLKMLDKVSDTIDEQLVKDKLNIADEPKENEDVGTDGNGTVSAEAVHTSRKRSEKEVSEIHTGLSEA